MNRTGLLIALALAAAVGLLFGIYPKLDLDLVRPFFDPAAGGFWASFDPVLIGLRDLSRLIVTLLVAPAVLAIVGKLVLPRRPMLIPGRAAVLMVATLALAPGLLTNVLLKSHWGRPRPIDVTEFGGDQHFVPWWDPRGDCPNNCSFVAGEPSGAFWTLAPGRARSAGLACARHRGALAFRGRHRAGADGRRRAFLHRRRVRRRVHLPDHLAGARPAVSLAGPLHHQRPGGRAGARTAGAAAGRHAGACRAGWRRAGRPPAQPVDGPDARGAGPEAAGAGKPPGGPDSRRAIAPGALPVQMVSGLDGMGSETRRRKSRRKPRWRRDETLQRVLQLKIRVVGDAGQFLALMQSATPFYQALGGKRFRFLRNVDDPAQLLVEIEYAAHAALELNRQKVASDPMVRTFLQGWRAILAGSADMDVYEDVTNGIGAAARP